ncbi:MAG: hypothetical protein ACO3NK_19820 [Prochlorotrichaceae cyanobacterium]
MFLKSHYTYLSLIAIVGTYIFGYGIARLYVFHAVELYPQGKGGPRQDYIAKKDQLPGEGWEYQFFLPMIKLEEALR